MINISNVSKTYDKKPVLSSVSLDIGRETVAVMGISGSGKTTLLRIISGLEKADSGSVSIKGKIAFSFADTRLFDNINVLDNVMCVLKGEKNEIKEKAISVLSALGIGDTSLLMPSELSTGMAQRVSLARAIVSERDVYLLDEPLRGLDEKTKKSVSEYLKKFLSSRCAVIVTHSEEEALFFTDNVYILSDGMLSKK